MKHLQIQTNFDASNLEKPYVVLDSENVVHYMSSEPAYDPYNGYEYVDLGLPSGLKWAKYNVGAETETDAGLYFQWGDVEGRTADEIRSKPCFWSTAPFNNGSGNYDESYFTAHKSEWLDNDILKPQYDAATSNMGGSWRMPTQADFEELTANTTVTWETNFNGVAGRKFTSNNDSTKYIFIPVTGYADYSSPSYQDRYGYVWSSSLNFSNPNNAWYLFFSSSNMTVGNANNRYKGYSVRGVCE